MKIEWYEDTAQGTNERPVWALRGAVNGVAAEVRHDVTLNTSTRRLEKLRLAVLDGIRAGLGLPEDEIREEDIKSVSAAMGALRRMALEAEFLEAEGYDQRLVGLCLEFSGERRDGSGTQEEPDTIEAVIRDWEAAGNTTSQNPEGRLVYFDTARLEATWDTQANDGLPLRIADGGWRPGTLSDLRRALGLEVK